ncbi:MAG: glycosyltransferase [Candidatus Aureabacteria bacterium]|nr:glycosyltransferase [Candidatus Auribacterota bacterium]
MNTLSVIIPCRNGRETVGKCLGALLAQTVKPGEVIAVDGASVDGSVEIIRRFPVTLLASPVPLSAGEARNMGRERATGAIIAFLDADAIPDPEWAERILRAFEEHPAASGVGGSVRDGSRSLAGRLEYLSNFSEFIPRGRPREISTIPTISVAYRRVAIEGMTFIPTTAGEDTMFNAELRARGGTLLFDPSIRVTHLPARRGLGAFFRNQYRCGLAFVYPRARFNLRGGVLLRHPWLLFLMPRLSVLLGRYLFTRWLPQFIVLLPLLAAGEAFRTAGVIEGRKVVRRGAY